MPVTKTKRTVAVGGLEWRDLDSDAPILDGYASTFNQPYDMGWYTETMIPGAFTKTLSENPDVRLLINHEGLPLGRTRAGTLTLTQDDTGLRVLSTLDGTDPDVQRLIPKMKRGDLNEMSFAFSVVRQTWSEDYEKRLITEVSLAGGDVALVTYPANPNAGATLRSKLLTEQPDKLRELYKRLHEQRDGMTLSNDEIVSLSAVLESLNTADESIADSMETIVNLLGAPRDADGNPIEDDNTNGLYMEAESLGRPVSLVRARTHLTLLRH